MRRPRPSGELPQLYRIEDLVERLRLCPAKIYKDMREHRLKPTYPGGGRALRFSECDVLNYIRWSE